MTISLQEEELAGVANRLASYIQDYGADDFLEAFHRWYPNEYKRLINAAAYERGREWEEKKAALLRPKA